MANPRPSDVSEVADKSLEEDSESDKKVGFVFVWVPNNILAHWFYLRPRWVFGSL